MTGVPISLGSIDFNSDVADGNGSLWYITEMAGWDSPPQRVSAISIPADHGGYTVENLYGARLITLQGICKATSGSNMYTSMYSLMSVTNALRTPITMKVTEDIQRRASVLRSGEVRTAYVGKGAFSFEINLRSDDPFKYAETASSEGLTAATPETLANAGTVLTYPTITMTASGIPVITIGGQTWTAEDTLPSGTVIDMKRMTVLDGTTSYFNRVAAVTDWLYLEPGNNTVESSVACTVAWRSAWV